VDFLKNSGLKIVAAAERGASDIADTGLTGPLALIIGSEDKGISRELMAITDESVKIPMRGEIGSLNVSVATGIMIYEITRQRGTR
jgi:23S rRNA (guanosine2251-2'-O)-methyltransferase